MKMRAKILIFVSIFLMLLSSEVIGQTHKLPEPQMSDNKSPGVPPPPGLPIDFGISALIASGVALGAYHIRKKDKK